MSVRRRGNSLQARLMIDGRTHSESFATRQTAEQWEITGARAIQGTLPTSVTVAQYAKRWMTTYENAPPTHAGSTAPTSTAGSSLKSAAAPARR